MKNYDEKQQQLQQHSFSWKRTTPKSSCNINFISWNENNFYL